MTEDRLPRARAKRTGAEVAAIVDEIAELLASGKYLGTKTKRSLAKKYDLSPSTIGSYVQQAIHRVRPVSEDVEETRRATIANLERTFEKALKGVGLTRIGGELLPIDPDYRAAVAAQKTIAEIGGAVAKGVQITIEDRRTGELHPLVIEKVREGYGRVLGATEAMVRRVFGEEHVARAMAALGEELRGEVGVPVLEASVVEEGEGEES